MPVQEKIQEEAISLAGNNTMADVPLDNDGAVEKAADVVNLKPRQLYSLILASNRLDVTPISPSDRLAELS